MKVLKGKYFLACYIKVNYPRILVDFMAVKPNNKTMMMLFLVGYSEVPSRRACLLRFFRFSFHPARNFPPARLLFYLVK